MDPVSLSNVPGVRAEQVVSGIWHSCALFSDRSVRCWGYGRFLGYGSGENIGDDELIVRRPCQRDLAARCFRDESHGGLLPHVRAALRWADRVLGVERGEPARIGGTRRGGRQRASVFVRGSRRVEHTWCACRTAFRRLGSHMRGAFGWLRQVLGTSRARTAWIREHVARGRRRQRTLALGPSS